VARVAAVFDDLLLGSNVLGMLRAAGHDAELAGNPDMVDPGAFDVLVVDLGGGFDGLALAGRGAKAIGVYSHVDVDTRRQAEAVGFDLVVPRSRMAREGADLVAKLAAS
jgi:hypothetical protein